MVTHADIKLRSIYEILNFSSIFRNRLRSEPYYSAQKLTNLFKCIFKYYLLINALKSRRPQLLTRLGTGLRRIWVSTSSRGGNLLPRHGQWPTI